MRQPGLPLSVRVLGPLAFWLEFGEVEVHDAAAVRAHQLGTMQQMGPIRPVSGQDIHLLDRESVAHRTAGPWPFGASDLA